MKRLVIGQRQGLIDSLSIPDRKRNRILIDNNSDLERMLVRRPFRGLEKMSMVCVRFCSSDLNLYESNLHTNLQVLDDSLKRVELS